MTNSARCLAAISRHSKVDTRGGEREAYPPSECPECGEVSDHVVQSWDRTRPKPAHVRRYRCVNVKCAKSRRINGFNFRAVRTAWEVEVRV